MSLELPFEAADADDAAAFTVTSPAGEPLLVARVDPGGLARARDRWRGATWSATLLILALTIIAATGPLLDWRNQAAALRVGGAWPYLAATTLMLSAIAAARELLRLASPADWSDATVFSGAAYASTLLRPLLTSPFDFLLTAFSAGAIVALLFVAVEALRLALRRRRRTAGSPGALARYLPVQLAAGTVIALVVLGHQQLVADTIANTTIDLLHLSLHPWDTTRLVLQVGLIVWHATALAAIVLVLRAATLGWRVPHPAYRLRAATMLLWIVPLAAWELYAVGQAESRVPALVAAAAGVGAAAVATRLTQRFRRGSQAFRLTTTTFGLVLPALVFYPTVFELGREAKVQLVETRYAPQAVNQRQTIQLLLRQSQQEIDEFAGLADLVTARPAGGEGEGFADRAFQVWRITSLAAYPATSSVELYGGDRAMLSRFAFNLPDLNVRRPSEEDNCAWDVFEEVAPFFAEERRVLHAGRAICAADGRRVGAVVLHAILDYANLPFIASQSPYLELLRPDDPLRGEGASGGDVEFALYGWSRQPLFASSGRAWPLDDAVFTAVERSRQPIWAQLRRGDARSDVYILNDRGGIYVLGFPVVDGLGHLVNLAELTVLAWMTCVLLLLALTAGSTLVRRRKSAASLLREIRASFYRKLLLAFMAATVVPVVALAVATGTYVADEMRANVEQEAVRTAAAARRVVEDLTGPRAADPVEVGDDLMVWVSRLIDQDVNIFDGSQLLATSERNLFASGLLPTRVAADVYRDIALRHDAAAVTRERAGSLEYLVSATPVSLQQRAAILTVPLTSRQREIERQIDTLYRQVLLGALLFAFCGAGIGYWLAERIADPVNRLTRATRRLARGDLDVRIAVTSSDELRRLVEDFNRMAADLARQRKDLERTNRLEAWAEVARQVAHDIKNPLTPIQLNAEHLRRVHADRGEPLGPVVYDCVSTILQQVTLLRQIASEFSNFASAPTARPAPCALGPLLREVVDPYRAGLAQIVFDIDVADDLPAVSIDRSLVARALTNVVENALHAMPGAGRLSVHARLDAARVRVRIADTGVGMDHEALARAFEPYFSTKATGTGIGLHIARRNVELSGGTIAIQSERERGTSVELTFPVA